MVGVLIIAIAVMWVVTVSSIASMLKARRERDEALSQEHHVALHHQVETGRSIIYMLTCVIEVMKKQGATLHCSACDKQLEIGRGMSSTLGVGERRNGELVIHCPDCIPLQEAPDTVPEDWQ